MNFKFSIILFLFVSFDLLSDSIKQCEVEALFLPRQSAEFFIFDSDNSSFFRGVSEESDSLAIQLYLWAYLLNKDFTKNVDSLLDIEKLLLRNDDQINSLIWLSIMNDSFLSDFKVVSGKSILDVNAWFSSFSEKYPMNASLSISESLLLYGSDRVKSINKEYLSADSGFISWNIYVQKALESYNNPKESYIYYKKAAELGALVFFDLAVLENRFFTGCEERFKISMKITFSAKPWLKKHKITQ